MLTRFPMQDRMRRFLARPLGGNRIGTTWAGSSPTDAHNRVAGCKQANGS